MFPSSIEDRPVYVPVGILILLLLFSCYWFIYKTISGLNEMHLVEKTEQGLRLQIALQKEQYGAIDEKIKADQIFRHDLRHHAKLLTELLAARKFEEALAYTKKLDNDTLERTAKNYCENTVVNAVLSNLLENAIENCHSETARPLLDISIKENKGQLCIRIRNSFGGRVWQDEDGTYLSTKLQGGIGLKSVAAIVAKHHGAINITHTKKNFTVHIAL